MIRLVKCSILIAVLSITSWAQMKVVERMPVIGHNAPATSNPPPQNNGIQYHGGPVMNDPHGTNVYFIWYGDWSNSPVPAILTNFIKNIGGTAYFNINSSYYDYDKEGEKDPVVNRINYGGSSTDNYSLGTSLSDQNLVDILASAISSGKLPNDPKQGAYFVLTSADVQETSGFCTVYCAFHGYDLESNGGMLPIGFIGNSDQCPSACTQLPHLPTPNNSVAADGMANMLAHELSETVTDPFGTAWYDQNFNENGDLCLWTFGKTKALPDGALYNVKFGRRPWLIQQIWVNARGGYCALAFDE